MWGLPNSRAASSFCYLFSPITKRRRTRTGSRFPKWRDDSVNESFLITYFSGKDETSICDGDDSSKKWVDSDDFFMERFKRRLNVSKLRSELSRPPNSMLGPREFVGQLLSGLRHPNHPTLNAGFHMLLKSSTSDWRKVLCQSVGATPNTPNSQIAPALNQAFGRPKNQFGILVGACDDETTDAEEFLIEFPNDPLDYEDGTCWLECRLRQKDNDMLFAVLGWTLKRRAEDGAWLLDSLDWQDFREHYRPGIGREEWERICG